MAELAQIVAGYGQIVTSGGFGKRVREARVARRLSLVALGCRVGVSGVTIWSWEKEKSKPRPEHLRALANALDLDARSLAGSEAATGPRAFEERLDAVIQSCRTIIAEVAECDPESVHIVVFPNFIP